MKKLLLLFFMATLCVAAMAQNDTIGLCGYSAQYVSQVNARSTGGAQSLSVLDKPTDFPANAIITCGRFTLYFQDIKNSTGQGFNHPTLGMLRRNCLCSVFSYIESVVQIAPVSPSNPVGASSQIEIEVGLSFDANATILGIASPYYAQNQIGSTTPGIFAGNPFTHITTGIDPEINAFDGVIMINFNNNPRITSDCSAAKAACDFDLFSIALHEMTHALGFASYIVDGGAGSPKSYSTVNQFTRFDNLFLFYGDLTSTKIKLLNGSSPANPVLNTGTNIANDKIWLYNSSTKTNQPISSRAALSHFDDRYRLGRCHDAPGFVPNYLMTGEGLSSFQIKREYTMQELRFLQQYGYTINPTYTNFSIIPNSPPYLLYNVGEGMITNNTSGPQSFIETLSGLPAITRLTPITSCQTKTITLGSSFGLIDENGDPIRIYPGSLTNLRGCGNGNNHNQLAVNSLASGDVITFTPRNNFIGLVQFGFHAWDGKEKGAFVVYSFYVTKDNACFNVTNELVINGSFEEGVELTTTLTPAIQNNLLYNSRFLSPESFPTWSQINGHWGGSKFIDGTFLTMQTVDVPIRNSHQNCVFGLSYENIPASEYPIPSGNNGNRYLSTLGETILAQLTENIQPCVRYKIEFDYFQNPPYGGATLNNNSNFIIGFLDTYNGLGGNGAGYGSSTINLPASVNIWTHFVGTVSVPSNIPVNCNLLSIVDYKQNASDPTTRFHIDNLSFMKDVTGACACNSQLPATINTNYTNQSLSIAQTVTISGNITFNNCDILMGKNAVIRVLAGSTLTLTSTNATQFSHLHACGDMWDGIYIQPGGNLIINNSTLVEDAINGVVAVDGSSKYTINGAIFNKNYYSIKLLPTTVTSVATRSIINSVFTCRIFGANPNVATFISNASLLTPMTKATLRVPHAGESAYTGIDVNAITGNNLNIGNRTLPINIFDNLYYGVWAHSSNVFVKHNTFENMTGSVTQCVTTPQPCSPCATICSTTNYGYAIYAETPAAANTYTVQAGGALSNERNTFTDCYEAVHSVDYANVIARYNNISNIAATRGNYGIYALSDAGATIQLTNNTINNCATAINHTRQGVNTSGTVNINSNTINTSGGAITNYGILMQDLTTAQQSKNIFISNNIISGVENGITLNSVKASAQVSGNTITLNNVNPTGAIRYGIALNNTGSGPGGNYTYVNGNTINGGIASPVSTNIGIIGIYSSLSPTSTINCNTVNNTGR
ncbi:MAG: right-handed parallel beta-helix repeat-containing protein, partial [Bacteroidia bacterium]|nr:right-handed parallel beta-helix repeat-containing protein [Bacteroidia bacterium]